jgi:hypothetical protein
MGRGERGEGSKQKGGERIIEARRDDIKTEERDLSTWSLFLVAVPLQRETHFVSITCPNSGLLCNCRDG